MKFAGVRMMVVVVVVFISNACIFFISLLDVVHYTYNDVNFTEIIIKTKQQQQSIKVSNNFCVFWLIKFNGLMLFHRRNCVTNQVLQQSNNNNNVSMDFKNWFLHLVQQKTIYERRKERKKERIISINHFGRNILCLWKWFKKRWIFFYFREYFKMMHLEHFLGIIWFRIAHVFNLSTKKIIVKFVHLHLFLSFPFVVVIPLFCFFFSILFYYQQNED